MTHKEKQIHNAVHAELREFEEFKKLVKRMREAQEELDVFEHKHDFFDYKAIMKRKELTSKVIKLEAEVDEYLKKMEELYGAKRLQD